MMCVSLLAVFKCRYSVYIMMTIDSGPQGCECDVGEKVRKRLRIQVKSNPADRKLLHTVDGECCSQLPITTGNTLAFNV